MQEKKNIESKEMSQGCFMGFMLFFLLVSIGLLYGSYSVYSEHSKIINHHILLEGEVIDLNLEVRNPTNTRQAINKTAPVLQFEYQGERYQMSSEQYSDIVDYKIGEKIEVFVNPEKPDKSIINTWSEKWGTFTLLLVLGGIFLILSLLSIFSSILKK